MAALNVAFSRLGGLGPKAGSERTWVPSVSPGDRPGRPRRRHRAPGTVVGDGIAVYTVQSLWTPAREELNVTTTIVANNSYQILKLEFGNISFGVPGPQASRLIDIDTPKIDFVPMGKSMGCPSVWWRTPPIFILP